MATLADVHLRDVIANRPAAGIAGRLFFTTDTAQTFRDSGTTWEDCTDAGSATGTANKVVATPDGTSGSVTVRALVAADIPSLPASKITSGTVGSARLGSGTADSTTYLRGDNTWSAPGGSGTVTSVALTVPSWLSVSGTPVTSSGTLAVSTATGQTANRFLATPDGTTGSVSLRAVAAADLPLATTGAFGAVKPDGTTITVSGGVITSTVSGGMTNPMTTTGDIIYGGSSGTPTRLAGATSGYVLTSNGATSAPSWQAATGGGGSGAVVLLEQHTASSSASIAFTTAISSTYDEYLIELLNVLAATAGSDLILQMSTDGGSTWDTGTNYGAAVLEGTPSPSSFSTVAGADSGRSSIMLCASTGNSSAFGISGSYRLFSPGGGVNKAIVGQTIDKKNDGHMYITSAGGFYLSTTAVTAFRILLTSGNVTSGTVRVYGIAKT